VGAMDDGGIQEEPPSARFLTPTRSGGTRWVDGSEVDSSESAPSWSLEDERSAGTVSCIRGTAAAREAAPPGGLARRRVHERARRARPQHQGAFVLPVPEGVRGSKRSVASANGTSCLSASFDHFVACSQ